MHARFLLFGLWGVALVAAGFAACEESPPSGGGGEGGSGGQGGCPSDVTALFTVTLKALDGPVPPDTQVLVTWSAGQEPLFDLDDPTTYKTLEDGSNLVCDVDASAPSPSDLEALECHLWTSGATRVEISAMGYLPIDQTLVPEFIDGCDVPIPTEVELTLEVDLDAGPPED